MAQWLRSTAFEQELRSVLSTRVRQFMAACESNARASSILWHSPVLAHTPTTHIQAHTFKNKIKSLNRTIMYALNDRKVGIRLSGGTELAVDIVSTHTHCEIHCKTLA